MTAMHRPERVPDVAHSTSAAMRRSRQPTRWHRLWSLAKRALMLELRVYACIGRFIVRRPAIAAGAKGFSYHRPVLTILIMFIVLSAIEIPVVDLIVHRWLPVRIGFLILGIWGVTWMFGLLCAYLMKPMTVGADGIRVRQGLEVDLRFDWDEIASVAHDHIVDPPKSPRFEQIDDARTLVYRMNDETNITVEFERGVTVTLPSGGTNGGQQTITGIRFWVDDPKAFLDAVRQHI